MLSIASCIKIIITAVDNKSVGQSRTTIYEFVCISHEKIGSCNIYACMPVYLSYRLILK